MMQNYASRAPCCGFCRTNRESTEVFRSHNLKDAQGRVVCPQLRRYVCPGCGATGDDAHTRSYCPTIVNARRQYQSHRNSERSSGSPPSTRSVAISPSSHLGADEAAAAASQPAQMPLWTSSESSNESQPTGNFQASNALGPAGSQPSPGYPSQTGGPAADQEIVIELGANMAFYNMSRVTNSRYNSAGQLRDRYRRGRHRNSNYNAGSERPYRNANALSNGSAYNIRRGNPN